MVSDAPLGSFLSGGIDSSAIVAEMKRATDDVTAYTIGFTDQDRSYEGIADDLGHARNVADLFELDYHEQILEPQVVELLPKLVYHLNIFAAVPAATTPTLISSVASGRPKLF